MDSLNHLTVPSIMNCRPPWPLTRSFVDCAPTNESRPPWASLLRTPEERQLVLQKMVATNDEPGQRENSSGKLLRMTIAGRRPPFSPPSWQSSPVRSAEGRQTLDSRWGRRAATSGPSPPTRAIRGWSSSGRPTASSIDPRTRGQRWRRLVPGFPLRGQSLDNIVVDPRGRVLVGYWEVAGAGGGVARSLDGGRTFRSCPASTGESVRALDCGPAEPRRPGGGSASAASSAPTTAGRRGGASAPRATPSSRNVESVADRSRRTRASSTSGPGTCRGRPSTAGGPGARSTRA